MSSRRWSAAAGFTTRRPGTEAILCGWASRERPVQRLARILRTSGSDTVSSFGALSCGIPLHVHVLFGHVAKGAPPRSSYNQVVADRTMLPVHAAPTCSVAGAAEIVGSKWTVLIVHDLSEGPRRFTELERSCAGISPRTLAERLRWLEDGGDRRASELPGVTAARGIRADGEGQGTPARRARDGGALGHGGGWAAASTTA